MRHIDCYPLAKKTFFYTLGNLRLVTVCENLGIYEKTRVSPPHWEAAKYATLKEKKKALIEIVDHCRYDVITLEKAYEVCFKRQIQTIGWK